jgi:ubiquinone/menaquinone biosynthesis C-methylase UbiE
MYPLAQTDTTSINLDDSPIPVYTRWLGSWRVSIHRRALSAPELAQSYDRVAVSWDRTLDRFAYPDAYERLLKHVLAERLPTCSRRPLRALDAGAGTGQLALALARASSTPVTIEAVDISAQMLERANKRMSRAGLDFAVRQADAPSTLR